jgi:hypothetical protein
LRSVRPETLEEEPAFLFMLFIPRKH